MEVEIPLWERLDEREEYAALVRQRLEHLVPVTEPLVLCSQIQRSGGTLLSQLFDGHPECHAHPHEIKIGWPREANWPPLDLDRPGEWFERLFEKKALTHFVEGYQKRGAKLEGKTCPSYDVFPFLFLPRLQKAIFDARSAGATERARRARRLLHLVLQRLARQPEPLHRAEEGRHRLHAAAGDGTRRTATSSSPRTPTARWSRSSASRSRGTGRRSSTASGGFPDAETAIGLWRESTEAALDERVVLVTYERLIVEHGRGDDATRGADRDCDVPGPARADVQRRPIRANSAEEVAQYGILPKREQPDPDAEVAELAGDLYERAVTVSV